MRLGDGARAIVLVGIGIIVIVTQGVDTAAGLVGLAAGLLIVALLLELTIGR